jgi:hypothetical protein
LSWEGSEDTEEAALLRQVQDHRSTGNAIPRIVAHRGELVTGNEIPRIVALRCITEASIGKRSAYVGLKHQKWIGAEMDASPRLGG